MLKLKVFEKNLISLQGNMLNFALRLTINKEDAKDLTQETSLKALNNMSKYYENVNFKGWIFTMMRNIFVNDYHRNIHRKTMTDQTDNLYHLNQSQNSGLETPDGEYAYSEMTKVVNSFNDEYKIPFWMYFTGYKYAEIAEEMEIPLGTIKSRIHFARKKLQKRLVDDR